MTNDQAWNEVYNLDGFGMSDYLNDFYPLGSLWKSSQHGERVYLQTDDAEFVIDRFDLWREEVSYYFDSFSNQQDEIEWEKAMPIFVYRTLRVFLQRRYRALWEYIEPFDTPPEGADEFLFC